MMVMMFALVGAKEVDDVSMEQVVETESLAMMTSEKPNVADVHIRQFVSRCALRGDVCYVSALVHGSMQGVYKKQCCRGKKFCRLKYSGRYVSYSICVR